MATSSPPLISVQMRSLTKLGIQFPEFILASKRESINKNMGVPFGWCLFFFFLPWCPLPCAKDGIPLLINMYNEKLGCFEWYKRDFS
jgi:hypothetical protein